MGGVCGWRGVWGVCANSLVEELGCERHCGAQKVQSVSQSQSRVEQSAGCPRVSPLGKKGPCLCGCLCPVLICMQCGEVSVCVNRRERKDLWCLQGKCVLCGAKH